ncbi:dCMP deaminase family protein [Phormidium sp. FACHB-1136]|uniref:deoxycytidylate deaminase n=1 Tax=Phormidium sp. FACHB-1136 TaxID=2692848 RepID=UPI001687F118|nr:dCMP deaminase family protein [Phormidium sp. FACHB-1136]MBD2426151.1 dCMP deaminase family protein [Phormidium sp. FACHB-1136]
MIQNKRIRPTWDEYFLMLAKLAATRSTCLARPVGAVIVKDKQVIATGYNGPPSGSEHCLELGYCYEGLHKCTDRKDLPSRAVHAEINAIAQAARRGVSTDNASIYVTLEPCLSCLKSIIASGIREIIYESPLGNEDSERVRDFFVLEGLIKLRQAKVSEEFMAKILLSELQLAPVNEGDL